MSAERRSGNVADAHDEVIQAQLVAEIPARKRVGITGTRVGATEEQKTKLVQLFCEFQMREFHHGCCVGVDAEAFWLLFELGSGGVLHAHPPVDEKAMDVSSRDESDVIHEPKYYLERNKDIVNESDMLIVVPKENDFKEGYGGGGTWATFRYAREKIPCVVVWPDGSETLTTPVNMR